MSLTCTKPRSSSIEPAQSGKREWPASRTSATTASKGSSASIQNIACRGTMMLRRGRSAKPMTPSSSSRSAAWKTPASVPSAIIALTSSSVTALGASPRRRAGRGRPRSRGAEPDDRLADRGEQRHRSGDEGGDALGIAEREALRHQLADDQRDIGGGDDDEGEGERTGDVGEAGARARTSARAPEGGAGEGAGEDADQGDADLDRREEARSDPRRAASRARRRGCRRADQLGFSPDAGSSGRSCRSTPPTLPGRRTSTSTSTRSRSPRSGPSRSTSPRRITRRIRQSSPSRTPTSPTQPRRGTGQRQHRGPDRHDQPRCSHNVIQPSEPAAGVRQLQRRSGGGERLGLPGARAAERLSRSGGDARPPGARGAPLPARRARSCSATAPAI